jgi:hypothetical protein
MSKQSKPKESPRVAKLKKLTTNIAMFLVQDTFVEEGDDEDKARQLLDDAIGKLSEAEKLLQKSDAAAAAKPAS